MRHKTNLNIRLVGAMAATLLLALIAGPAAALTDTDVDLKIFGAAGYVADGDSLEYDHFMSSYNDPTKDITGINDSWLFVAIADVLFYMVQEAPALPGVGLHGESAPEVVVARISLTGVEDDAIISPAIRVLQPELGDRRTPNPLVLEHEFK